MSRCILFHKWGRWKMYQENGSFLSFKKGDVGGIYGYTETRQMRTCASCGMVDDEWIKDGPMPKTEPDHA